MILKNFLNAIKYCFEKPKSLLPFLISAIIFLLIYIILSPKVISDKDVSKIFFHLDFKLALKLFEEIFQIEGMVIVTFFPLIFFLLNIFILELLSYLYFIFILKNKVENLVVSGRNNEVEIIGKNFETEYNSKITNLLVQIYLSVFLEILLLYLNIYLDHWFFYIIIAFVVLISNVSNIIFARQIVIQNAFYRKVALNETSFNGLAQIILDKARN